MEITLSFVRIIRLNWIGYVNRMDSNREVRQVRKFHPRTDHESQRGSRDIAPLFL